VPVALGLAALAYVGMTLDRVESVQPRWWEFWKDGDEPGQEEGVSDQPSESLPEDETCWFWQDCWWEWLIIFPD